MPRAFSVAAVVGACNLGQAAGSSSRGNPIRKVTNLLENMQKKVEEQGGKEKALFDKAMCFCQTQKQDLQKQIDVGKASIEMLTSSQESGANAMKELAESLKLHKASRTQAKEDLATATKLREKEAAAFASFKATTEENAAALTKAVAALEQGLGSSFIQTTAASVVKNFVMEKAVMSDGTRDEVLAFLSGSDQDDENAAGSGEIVGILKQMGDQMADSLAEASEVEAKAVTSFQSLLSAKTKEIDTLTAQIEEEMMRGGEAALAGAGGGNALDDAKEQLEDTVQLLATTEEGCEKKKAEYEEIKKGLAVELVAIADVIKMLTSDEALEMFKKTLPGASSSFLQIVESSVSVKKQALTVLSSVPRRHLNGHPELDLIALALQGKTKGFEAVIAKIDRMIATLKKEQGDDDKKKTYCEAEFDKNDDTKKELKLAIEDSETAIEEVKGSIAERTEEVAALKESIQTLDMDVEEAADQRKQETAEYKTLVANNGVAKELLLKAKNKLAKVYAAFLQGSARKQNGSGVIAMIDDIIKDLDKENQEAGVAEKGSQKRFEEMSEKAKTKRAQASESLTNCEAAKAEAEQALETEMGNMQETNEKLMQNAEVNMGLHKECDWILKNYDMRKQARTAEIEAIGKAKAVLSGADASLLQVHAHHKRLYR